MKKTIAILIAAAFLATACSKTPTGPDSERRPFDDRRGVDTEIVDGEGE